VSDRRLTIPEWFGRSGVPVPTGPLLLQFVRWAGDRMLEQLRHGNHALYLEQRDFYIDLLDIAQKDSYCAPRLTESVQRVLDEENQSYRDRKGRD
jgi:hypothetical protein